jgi:hypothetical protein
MPRWRRVRFGEAGAQTLAEAGSFDDLAASAALAVGAIVVAVILIPLLLFGIELILLGVLVAAAILGRALLARPWVVHATRDGATQPSYTWRVSGWRRSRRLLAEAIGALGEGREPAPAEAEDLTPPAIAAG